MTLFLHDYLNPNRIVALETSDFSCAAPYLSGAAVYRKDVESPVFVHETPEQIAALIEEEKEK